MLTDKLTELSLFTGMGGGIYGSLILGWKTLAYVEKDKYCQKIIKQRIDDGWFDKGEIYGELQEFNKHHAKKYTGKIDVLTGGFPCQPFSVAGKRKGTSDARYLQREIIKTIKIVQPRRILFENVPGILSDPAIIDIYKTITKAGYRLKPPLELGSAECDNIHRRKRVWIFAISEEFRSRRWQSEECHHEGLISQPFEQERATVRCETTGCAIRGFLATNDSSERCNHRSDHRQKRQVYKTENGNSTKDQPEWDKRESWTTPNTGIYHSNHRCERKQGIGQREIYWGSKVSRRESIRRIEDLLQRPDIPEPLLWGMDDELPDWSKQLKAIGNGQDPIVMATAWHILSNYNEDQ